MDELTNQLRALGEAAESAVTPTSPEQITSQPIDLRSPGDQQQPARRPSRQSRVLLIAAAVAVVAIAIGSSLFINRDSDEPAQLDIANQTTDDVTQTFTVPSSDNGWEQLRFCESTSNYSSDTGNTFYGAYQFTYEAFAITTERLNLVDYIGVIPSVAPPEVQDAAANALYLDVGAEDGWPICGRFINGPMITPVVPQWMGGLGRSGVSTLVFLDPDAEAFEVDAVRAELDRIVGSSVAEAMIFVSQQEAYDEFQQMFDGSDEMRDSVSVADMPASFRIRAESLTFNQVRRIEALPGVFNVVEPDALEVFDPPPPLKIEVPVLGLQAPVFESATLENLAKGPVVLAGNVPNPVLAGYGSVDGAVFAQLGDLVEGDLIAVTSLTLAIENQRDASETIRTYSVTEVLQADVQELPTWSVAEDRSGLTLVADVPGDPNQRLVVHAAAADPETASYGLELDN